MRIGSKEFDVDNHTHIMGILNVTPDSFSDGGKYMLVDNALKRAEEMIKEGADIIDVGGESTRPGYVPVSEVEQIERVIPVIEKIKNNFDTPVSIDTYKAGVAQAAIEAGIDLVNDIWALQDSELMAEVVAKSDVACVLMHNRKSPDYDDFMHDVCLDLSEYIKNAEKAGIPDDKIIIDPGVGFGKTYEQNLMIINNLEEFHMFGYPILIGTSRKSVIGLTLDLPIFERVEGTLATTVMSVMKGAAFVRVHDVKENARAIRMTEAILGR